MGKYLYRGVNPDFFEKSEGKLAPKDNRPFLRAPMWDEAEWDNAFWGECEANAAIEHQQHQAGYPTSGISTSPHIERAKLYALSNGEYDRGFIYVIDPDICRELEVSIFVVSEVVPKPFIPEDQEVILVAKDFGVLPQEIIINIREFNA